MPTKTVFEGKMSLVKRFICKRKEKNYCEILSNEVKPQEEQSEGNFENKAGTIHIRSYEHRLSNKRNINRFDVNEMSLNTIDTNHVILIKPFFRF